DRPRVRGFGWRAGLRRSQKPAAARRHGAGLRHEPDQQWIHFQQPEREEHLRVRCVLQRRGYRAAGRSYVSTSTQTIEELANREYKYGFVTDVEQDAAPRGLSEDIVRLISSKKGEPEWLLDWRLKAYRMWLTMKERAWQHVTYAPVAYQNILY